MSLEIAIEQGPDQRSGGAASPKILSVARIQMVQSVVVGDNTPMLVIDNLLMATAIRWANFVRYISFEKWNTGGIIDQNRHQNRVVKLQTPFSISVKRRNGKAESSHKLC